MFSLGKARRPCPGRTNTKSTVLQDLVKIRRRVWCETDDKRQAGQATSGAGQSARYNALLAMIVPAMQDVLRTEQLFQEKETRHFVGECQPGKRPELIGALLDGA